MNHAGLQSNLAESWGFEPQIEFAPYTRLAGEHLRPLGQLSVCNGKYYHIITNMSSILIRIMNHQIKIMVLFVQILTNLCIYMCILEKNKNFKFCLQFTLDKSVL